MKKNWDGEDGVWGVTNPPQEYNWGDSCVHACTGTDNPEQVKDIILAVTGNQENLLKISKEYLDYTNTKSSMQKVAEDRMICGCFRNWIRRRRWRENQNVGMQLFRILPGPVPQASMSFM